MHWTRDQDLARDRQDRLPRPRRRRRVEQIRPLHTRKPLRDQVAEGRRGSAEGDRAGEEGARRRGRQTGGDAAREGGSSRAGGRPLRWRQAAAAETADTERGEEETLRLDHLS